LRKRAEIQKIFSSVSEDLLILVFKVNIVRRSLFPGEPQIILLNLIVFIKPHHKYRQNFDKHKIPLK
jgi:hypothetical protein